MAKFLQQAYPDLLDVGDKTGRAATLVLLLLAICAGSYAAFRQTNQEVWPKDKQTYVIFPSGAMGQTLYYAWRPLSYADSALTGIRFHVGRTASLAKGGCERDAVMFRVEIAAGLAANVPLVGATKR